MHPNQAEGYLSGLPEPAAAKLREANRAGIAAWHSYLGSGQAVAFLGAGVSTPLYPLWSGAITELIGVAVSKGLDESAALSCRSAAMADPDAVVEYVADALGQAQYQAALREVFRIRRDPETGRTWTDLQELVCRCAFKAIVTTNFDPGILDARMRVRQRAVATGFATWTDEIELDRWRRDDVFTGDDELPVLYAHGHHNRPEAMVLATNEYRRAYGGEKLGPLIGRMVDAWHLVWLGFSFNDQRVAAILRAVAEKSGSRIHPGAAPRHVAVMAWDPDGSIEPSVAASLASIQYGASLVLYPAPKGDHSALTHLLSSFTDPRYPAVTAIASVDPRARGGAVPVPKRWVHGEEHPRQFIGRQEELARLDRWSADSAVQLIAVSAWGGAGKTTLVTQWLRALDSVAGHRSVRGLFAWSFYADSDVEHWAEALLKWATTELGYQARKPNDIVSSIGELLHDVPVVLLLDGLEGLQEGPSSDTYGRLLYGPIRQVLTAACRQRHRSLLVLTSRFPFADLARFDGTSARMLDLPPFTPEEGAALLATSRVVGVSDAELRRLVQQVDGHALAVSAMAAMLTHHPDRATATAAQLLSNLAAAGPTGAKVARVLAFYADTLSPAQRHLTAAVCLFARPVSVNQVLAVAGHKAFAGQLAGLDAGKVRAAVQGPLSGLLLTNPRGELSAHPLVRQTFRPLVYGAAEVAVSVSLTGTPEGPVTTHDEAAKVVEAIELLLEAGQWRLAAALYRDRTAGGNVWLNLPDAQLGLRASSAFATNDALRGPKAPTEARKVRRFHLIAMGVSARNSGDLTTAVDSLRDRIRNDKDANKRGLTHAQRNLALCLALQGQPSEALKVITEAFGHSTVIAEEHETRQAHWHLAWALDGTGQTALAEQTFLEADHLVIGSGSHMNKDAGCWWASFLARTGRRSAAKELAEGNLDASLQNGWNGVMARCQVVLARLHLVENRPGDARPLLDRALEVFRAADFLVDLAEGLVVSAEQARAIGDLAAAGRDVADALDIAVPRGLIPPRAAALAARARIAGSRFEATGNVAHLAAGRDDADAALRLATGADPMPWMALEAVEAHTLLDRLAGADHGWSQRAAEERSRLIPAGLLAEPLRLVEAAAKKVSGAQA